MGIKILGFIILGYLIIFIILKIIVFIAIKHKQSIEKEAYELKLKKREKKDNLKIE